MTWWKHCMCGQPTSSSRGRWSAGLFQVPRKKNRPLNACNRAHQEKRLWKLPLSIKNKGKHTISNQFIDDISTSHPPPPRRPWEARRRSPSESDIRCDGHSPRRPAEASAGRATWEKGGYCRWVQNSTSVERWFFPIIWIGFQPSGWWCRIFATIHNIMGIQCGTSDDKRSNIHHASLSLSENQYQFLYGILWERKWTRISRFWGNLFFDKPIKWRWTHIINSSNQFYTKKVKHSCVKENMKWQWETQNDVT